MSVPIAGHGSVSAVIPQGNIAAKTWDSVPMAAGYWLIPGGGIGTPVAGNGGFEVDTTGWAVIGSAVLARDTTEKLEGAASGKVTVNATGAGVGYALTLTAGKTYTVSAWVKAPAGKSLRLRFLDAGGNPVSAFVPVAGTGNWNEYSVTYVSGGGAVSVQVYEFVTSTYPYNFNLDGVRVVGS